MRCHTAAASRTWPAARWTAVSASWTGPRSALARLCRDVAKYFFRRSHADQRGIVGQQEQIALQRAQPDRLRAGRLAGLRRESELDDVLVHRPIDDLRRGAGDGFGGLLLQPGAKRSGRVLGDARSVELPRGTFQRRRVDA